MLLLDENNPEYRLYISLVTFKFFAFLRRYPDDNEETALEDGIRSVTLTRRIWLDFGVSLGFVSELFWGLCLDKNLPKVSEK